MKHLTTIADIEQTLEDNRLCLFFIKTPDCGVCNVMLDKVGKLAEELIAHGGNINFIKWEAGSVLPETGRAMEHMASFDYGYKIAAVRDWLFRQSK